MWTEVITDETPGGDEIAVEVRGLCTGRVSGPSGVWAEHLKALIREVTQEKDRIT